MVTEDDGIVEDSYEQIEQQGTACYKVDDGEVFMFTTATLEKLLARSQETGKVIVFIKTRATA